MPLSWNEIRQRAIKFSREWEGEARESAEYASFWNDFFDVFGIRRRTVASFQEPVRKLSGDYGFIDLFWKGTVLVEHKSLGKSFDKAECQAFDYIQALCNGGREEECPRYVILSDYKRIKLFDLEPDDCALPLVDQTHCAEYEFELRDFHKNVHLFAFIPGYKQYRHHDEAPVNLKAVKLLSDLHIELEKSGYGGHDLEVFLVRILFCFFADDTGIFERDSFKLYIENKTHEDGSDLGMRLARLFQLLNTPPERRQTNLDEDLAAFPYVNGGLFAEKLNFADLNRTMRERLLRCANFDWAAISPAAFGSLFQGIMDAKTRRELGAHYTSEADILKLIRPLFLDELRAEFEAAKNDRSSRRKQRLEKLLAKLPTLTFFDPACGCGNFLIIAYRELRLLEIDILKELFARERASSEKTLGFKFSSKSGTTPSRVDVDQFYGIELEEWPARIAEVSLWLMDHKMNQELSLIFGELYVRIPLKKSPNIHVGNALTNDWKTIIPPEKCSYILGNPPFAGRRYRTPEQMQLLVRLYGCDMPKSLVLLGTEKVLFTLDGGNEYKLAFIQSVSEKVRLGNMLSLFPEMSEVGYKMFDLESRRYIGNKAKLTRWIMNIITEHTGGFSSFFDVFAGTASVSKAAIPYVDKIIMNDFLSSNNIIYQAFFAEGIYDMNKLYSIIEYYNSINPDSVKDNYFSDNFGDKFFDYKNSKLIGYIREDIERKRYELTPKEYAILLASLIYSIDKIANTVGHFDAYIKKKIVYHPLSLQLVKPLEPKVVEIHKEDSNMLARRITADVAYIDPPYNSRQYSRFYHIYENLVEWKKPELFGVAMKPKAQNMSAYCTSSAPVAFRDLIQNLNVKYIAVSYNNTYDSKSGSSKNKITLEQIKYILEERGDTVVYDCAHRCFNTGKTEFADHRELLFITEVRR